MESTRFWQWLLLTIHSTFVKTSPFCHCTLHPEEGWNRGVRKFIFLLVEEAERRPNNPQQPAQVLLLYTIRREAILLNVILNAQYSRH